MEKQRAEESQAVSFFLGELTHTGSSKSLNKWREVLEIERETEMKGGDEKMDRKTVEKNRRIRMKNLCLKLSSLIPNKASISKEAASKQDHLDRAAVYIQELRERIERLKQRKELAASGAEGGQETNESAAPGFRLPVIEVRLQEQQNLEVLLISGSKKKFFLHEVLGILDEEGAEAVNASFSVVGNKIFYTIHSKAISSRIGLDASRVSDRLQKLIK